MSDDGSLPPDEPVDPLPPEKRALVRKFAEEMHAWQLDNPNASSRQREHQLMRICFQDDGAADLAAGFAWESDRGLVLVVAQVINDMLEEMLSKFFRAHSDISAKELDFWFRTRPMPPLQSTGLKIKLAGALGLITRPLMNALEKVQSIRSRSAAHSRHTFQLSDQDSDSVAQCLGDLLPAERRAKDEEHDVPLMTDDVVWSSVAKKRFFVVAINLVMFLDVQACVYDLFQSGELFQSTEGSSK